MNERKCYRCKATKPLTEFYGDPAKSGGRNYECKECTKARVAASNKANPDKQRDRHLRRSYGITLAQFNRMVLAQGSTCACCGTDKPGGKHNQWCVDHDHLTGAVRELLCKDCNIVLGIVQDCPEHLHQMMTYIVKHNESQQRTAE